MGRKAIGGYFELEVREGKEYHSEAIRLNTGRHALEYILTTRNYRKIYLPYYTCGVILELVHKLGIDVEFYSINEKFEPSFDFSTVLDNEVFLYTNYFGLCLKQAGDIAAQKYNVIIDNSQSFYSKPFNSTDTFYSARKFFSVHYGAYLYSDIKIEHDLEIEDSSERFKHLIQRTEKGAEAGYKAFKENDRSFKSTPIKMMSKISQKLLAGIDYDFVKERRRQNFGYLSKYLNRHNELKIDLGAGEVPLAYPFLTDQAGLREYLIEQKVFVPTYWPNVIHRISVDSLFYKFYRFIIYLPIDPRYDIDVISTIKNF